MSYPDNIDSIPQPSATSPTNNPSASGVSVAQTNAILALEKKLGITSSTPTNGYILTGAGPDSSTWEAPSTAISGLTTSNLSATAGILGSQLSSSAGILGSQLIANTITATQIANNTITATQIANATITATQIANSSVVTLYNPYKFSVYRNATYSLTGAAHTAPVIFDTVDFDTSGNYSTSTGKYTIPISGFYQFTVVMSINNTGSAGSVYQIEIWHNTTQHFVNLIYGAAGSNYINGALFLQCTAGDTIYVDFYNGGATDNMLVGLGQNQFQSFLVSAT